jgi:AcrR family transcriptional regulator
MRTKDGEKQRALFEATVKTVNAVGFAAASVSKIAKEAGVSPATLYVYYDNKEDLLASTYIDIKRDFSRAILMNFDPGLPIRDILRHVWMTMFEYISSHPEYFRFSDQFANSPYYARIDREMVEGYFAPLIDVLKRGIRQKIIKDVPLDVLTAFMVYPLMALSNPNLCADFDPTTASMEMAFNLAWDAIRL